MEKREPLSLGYRFTAAMKRVLFKLLPERLFKRGQEIQRTLAQRASMWTVGSRLYFPGVVEQGSIDMSSIRTDLVQWMGQEDITLRDEEDPQYPVHLARCCGKIVQLLYEKGEIQSPEVGISIWYQCTEDNKVQTRMFLQVAEKRDTSDDTTITISLEPRNNGSSHYVIIGTEPGSCPIGMYMLEEKTTSPAAVLTLVR